MNLSQNQTCPYCGHKKIIVQNTYYTVHNGNRQLFCCKNCQQVFSQTHGTPMANLKTPLSKVAGVLRVRGEGMGQRATARIFGIHKNSVAIWEKRFAEQKAPLMLYAVCHEFINLTFEGDELYTIVGKRGEAHESEGWTAIILERASRFIIAQQCGEKNKDLFTNVMNQVVAYIEQTQDVTFLSDGERRYGNHLFELCATIIRTGKVGRPATTLPEGVKLRIKNKGSQAKKRGRKRPKYQAPQREHPNTKQDLEETEIHANHVEAQNAALRRKNSAFRRRTNTYAKTMKALQRTLDVHQIIHNFIRPHWTTGKVPAVAMGILMAGLRLEDVLTERFT